MGVGPPRFGLRPGVDKKPGFNLAYPHGASRRTIHYPGDDSARYPGVALYTFVRRITQPGTDSTKYPGTDLLIRGAPRSRSDVALLAGSALVGFVRAHFGRVRRTTMAGGGAVLGETGTASSTVRTTMSVDVSLATIDETVELAEAVTDSNLGDVLLDVEL